MTTSMTCQYLDTRRARACGEPATHVANGDPDTGIVCCTRHAAATDRWYLRYGNPKVMVPLARVVTIILVALAIAACGDDLAPELGPDAGADPTCLALEGELGLIPPDEIAEVSLPGLVRVRLIESYQCPDPEPHTWARPALTLLDDPGSVGSVVVDERGRCAWLDAIDTRAPGESPGCP